MANKEYRQEKTWSDIIYSYNTSLIESDYFKEENVDINLKQCPTCGKVFEHRYEQLIKKTICYIYSQLNSWAFKSPNQSIPKERLKQCKSSDCSGDMYVYYY